MSTSSGVASSQRGAARLIAPYVVVKAVPIGRLQLVGTSISWRGSLPRMLNYDPGCTAFHYFRGQRCESLQLR